MRIRRASNTLHHAASRHLQRKVPVATKAKKLRRGAVPTTSNLLDELYPTETRTEGMLELMGIYEPRRLASIKDITSEDSIDLQTDESAFTEDYFLQLAKALEMLLPNDKYGSRIIHSFYQFKISTPRQRIEHALEGLDKIWQYEKLFSDEMDDKLRTIYLNLLIYVALKNKDYFEETKRDDINHNFRDEFLTLCQKEDLDLKQRTISATQALELALLGVDPTIVLNRINNAKAVSTKGYLYEIQSAWFLAKFKYRISDFRDRWLILSAITSNVSFKNWRIEIDMITPDALVEVKSKSNHSGIISKICNLIALAMTDQSLARLDIKKIIIIKPPKSPEQYSPSYTGSPEQIKAKKYLIRNAIIELEKFNREVTELANLMGIPSDELNLHNSLFGLDRSKRLLSLKGIEVYYVPVCHNHDQVSDWIKLHYQILQTQRELETYQQ